MKKLAIAIGWLASLVLVAAFASSSAMKNQMVGVGVELDKTQAMLAFNHMARYRELESDLTKGCYSEALEKAKISKDQELSLLASLFKEHPDTSFSQYVSDRDPALVEQLKTFKSAYGNSWKEPQCGK